MYKKKFSKIRNKESLDYKTEIQLFHKIMKSMKPLSRILLIILD